MEALLRYPPIQRRAKAQEWARRSHENRAPSELPHEDQVKRALWDRKGTIIREGVTYCGDGRIIQWCIRHSLHGKSNQLDVVIDGATYLTAGQRRIDMWLKQHTR
jgi:hypothetical protein